MKETKAESDLQNNDFKIDSFILVGQSKTIYRVCGLAKNITGVNDGWVEDEEGNFHDPSLCIRHEGLSIY
jgi:hypothetical protein